MIIAVTPRLDNMAWSDLLVSQHHVSAAEVEPGSVLPIYQASLDGTRAVCLSPGAGSQSFAHMISGVHPLTSVRTEVARLFDSSGPRYAVLEGTMVVAVQLVGPTGQRRSDAVLMEAANLGLVPWQPSCYDSFTGPQYTCAIRRCICRRQLPEEQLGCDNFQTAAFDRPARCSCLATSVYLYKRMEVAHTKNRSDY